MSPEPERYRRGRRSRRVVVEDAEELIGNDEAPNSHDDRPRLCFLRPLSPATFSWRYVAIVSLVYGVNQGVGEACHLRRRSIAV